MGRERERVCVCLCLCLCLCVCEELEKTTTVTTQKTAKKILFSAFVWIKMEEEKTKKTPKHRVASITEDVEEWKARRTAGVTQRWFGIELELLKERSFPVRGCVGLRVGIRAHAGRVVSRK